MPAKKKVPPTKPKPPDADNDNTLDVARSIGILESMMKSALHPEQGLDMAQFQDTMDMFLALMHLKKVTPEYWIKVAGLPTRGINIASLIGALTVMERQPKLAAETKKMIQSSIEINTKALAGIRTKMVKAFEELAEIPPPGTAIN